MAVLSRRTLLVAVGYLSLSCWGPEGEQFPIDFEDLPSGNITEYALSEGWVSRAESAARAYVVREHATNKVLSVAYPAGGVGPGQTGVQLIIKTRAASEYYLSYRVKFDDSFDFRNGGKLPGLSSAGCKYTGGVVPTVGEGWSARLWWGPVGQVAVYLYHFGMAGPWGDVLRLTTPPIAKSVWHSLVQHVRLNTGAEANGILQVWLDGTLALDRRDITFRIGGMAPIETLCFSTFHGGSDPSKYAPLTSGHAMFDDFNLASDPPPGVELPLE
jgi:hypothetical protein